MRTNSKHYRSGFLALACCLALGIPANGFAATWTPVTPFPGGGRAGVMLLLTDGTVMMVNDVGPGWLRLTPDSTGNYAAGAWSPIAPMSQERLFFASQILPSGKLWVLGGEYTGPQTPRTDSATAEIYDPVTNSWSTAAPYPAQGDVCGTGTIAYSGNIVTGSNVITGIPSTVSFYVGWTVVGPGIPGGATIVTIDSKTQVTISSNATGSGTADLTFSGPHPSCFGATETLLLPGGTQILAGSLVDKTSRLYNIATNTWTSTGSKLYDQSDEESWTLTSAPGKVLVYDIDYSANQNAITGLNRGYAEAYNPATGTWASVSPADGTANGVLPLLSTHQLGNEFGSTLRLQDGRILQMGGNGATAFYTPSTNTWAAGPIVTGTLNGQPATFGPDDAAAAIMPNGHVFFAADAGPATPDDGTTGDTTADSNVITNIPNTSIFQVGWGVADGNGGDSLIPQNTVIVSIDNLHQVTVSENITATRVGASLRFGGTFSAPTQLFDFNPAGAGSISALSPAYPVDLTTTSAFVTRMLVLPTGQVLFGLAGNSTRLYIYTPDGSASPALRPVINNITYNGGGKFTMTGRQLDGQSAGAAYGDDVQMDSNYPILRLVNSAGKVFYCRTTNWFAGVGEGTAVTHTVNFTLNPSMPAGNYSAIVSGAGISSFPVGIVITQAEVNGQ